MTTYRAYDKAMKEIAETLKKCGFLQNLAVICDVDGVFHNLGDLSPDKSAMTGLAILQPMFKFVTFLTGRYPHLVVQQGLPALRKVGFNIDRNFSIVAEMGG